MTIRRYYITDLSVATAPRQLAAADTTILSFDAGEAIDTATAALRRLDTGDAITGDAAPEVNLSGTLALVTVSGLTRGIVYELAVTFNDGAWTRTLVLDCVA